MTLNSILNEKLLPALPKWITSAILPKSNYIILIPPLWVNISSALLTVLYLKVVMEIASFIRRKIGNTISRKMIHVCAGTMIVFWPLFDVTHWSWRLNILVPAAMSVKLFYKGLILNDPNDIDVQNISRSSSPSELLYGPLQFGILMMWLGLCKYMTVEGVVIMAALGIGDGIAPIVGKYYGRMRYTLHPLATEKSVEGSFFGVFLGTIMGCIFFLYVFQMPMIPIQTLIHYGLVSTIAEASSPGNYDNVFIPLVLHLTFFRQ